MSNQVQQQYYSLTDAGKYLGRSKRWVETRIAEAKLPRRWLGERLVLTREDLDSLVKTEESTARRHE